MMPLASRRLAFFKRQSRPSTIKPFLQYGPIEYIWFDHAVSDGGLSHAETLAWCKSFQPGCFIGFNHGEQEGTDIRLGELGRPGPLNDAQAKSQELKIRQAGEASFPVGLLTLAVLNVCSAEVI